MLTASGMFNRHADHGIRQPLNIVHVAGNGRIAEIEIQHVCQFVKVAFIDAFIAQQREIAEDSRDHLITVRQPFVGQVAEIASTPLLPLTTGSESARIPSTSPCFCSQSESARATVTNKIGDQFIRFTAELCSIVINAELNA